MQNREIAELIRAKLGLVHSAFYAPETGLRAFTKADILQLISAIDALVMEMGEIALYEKLTPSLSKELTRMITNVCLMTSEIGKAAAAESAANKGDLLASAMYIMDELYEDLKSSSIWTKRS